MRWVQRTPVYEIPQTWAQYHQVASLVSHLTQVEDISASLSIYSRSQTKCSVSFRRHKVWLTLFRASLTGGRRRRVGGRTVGVVTLVYRRKVGVFTEWRSSVYRKGRFTVSCVLLVLLQLFLFFFFGLTSSKKFTKASHPLSKENMHHTHFFYSHWHHHFLKLYQLLLAFIATSTSSRKLWTGDSKNNCLTTVINIGKHYLIK